MRGNGRLRPASRLAMSNEGPQQQRLTDPRCPTKVERRGSATAAWVDEDFVDSATEPVVENDPWEAAPSASASSPPVPVRRGGFPDAAAARQAGTEDVSSDFAADLAHVDESDGVFDPPSDWAEPDPTIEASSELGESLYPPDPTITDLSRDIKIGELLAHIEPITEEQRTRCHEVLSACDIRRLRRWIPWLRNRDWCGAKLRLFLEFRCHWDSPANSRWWETFWWDWREQEWMPRYRSGTLTLDHCLELVVNRGPCEPADVIDPDWFAEWEEHAAWELGVHSFASFAVFRAGIPDGDDWLQRLSRLDPRTPLDKAQCADGGFSPFMLPSFAQQYGLPRVLGDDPHPWFDSTGSLRRLVDGY